MIAVSLYRLDARARTAFVAARADVSGWPEPDLDQIDRYRRMVFASLYFAYPGVAPETMRKALACMPSPCPALIEAAGGNRAFGTFATPDNLDLTIELAKSRGCDEPLLDRVAHTRELSASDALTALSDVDTRIPDFFDGR
jgi:hypothetical protein